MSSVNSKSERFENSQRIQKNKHRNNVYEEHHDPCKVCNKPVMQQMEGFCLPEFHDDVCASCLNQSVEQICWIDQ